MSVNSKEKAGFAFEQFDYRFVYSYDVTQGR